MQPVGQALAQLVGLFVLLGFEDSRRIRDMRCGLDTLYHDECREAVDGIWRIVIGSGAVPALFAIIFRFFLFDCGIYSLEVRNKPAIAIMNTQRVYGAPSGVSRQHDDWQLPASNNMTPHHTRQPQLSMRPSNAIHQEMSPQPMPVQFSREDLYNYFIRDGNWYYLLGTSATWFVLDVSFYGLSLDNRGTLSSLWATTQPTAIDENLACWNSAFPNGTSTVPDWQRDGLPIWQTDATHPCNTIYDVLVEQTQQYLLTVSVASIAGSVCFVIFANRIPRRQWLTSSFLILTLVFMITGGVFYGVHESAGAPATVAFVALCHFMFNFGKATLKRKVLKHDTNTFQHRRKYIDLHSTRRNFSYMLPVHVSRHFCCGRQAWQHCGRFARLPHQP